MDAEIRQSGRSSGERVPHVVGRCGWCHLATGDEGDGFVPTDGGSPPSLRRARGD